jgi:hypothetical protein
VGRLLSPHRVIQSIYATCVGTRYRGLITLPRRPPFERNVSRGARYPHAEYSSPTHSDCAASVGTRNRGLVSLPHRPPLERTVSRGIYHSHPAYLHDLRWNAVQRTDRPIHAGLRSNATPGGASISPTQDLHNIRWNMQHRRIHRANAISGGVFANLRRAPTQLPLERSTEGCASRPRTPPLACNFRWDIY